MTRNEKEQKKGNKQMSNLTPGPWKVHNGYRVYSPSRLVGEDGQQYFEVAICGTDFKSGSLGETEANACLIAASPDLLSALKDMVEMFEAHINGEEGPDDAASRWDKARMAIAKAEGIKVITR